MSTQWKKYPQDIPEPGEPIWWLPLGESSSVRFYYFEPQTSRSAFLWQPAVPPAPPPDDSEAAFEEWRRCFRRGFTDERSVAYSAWMAALAWHKNKTKE